MILNQNIGSLFVKSSIINLKESKFCAKGVTTCKNHEDYDPRSYCHNILSHPDNVCKKNACQKFMKNVEHDTTDDDIVCTPTSTCRSERVFESPSSSPSERESSTYSLHLSSGNAPLKNSPDKEGKDIEIIYDSSKHRDRNTITSSNKVKPRKTSEGKNSAQVHLQHTTSRKSTLEKSLDRRSSERSGERQRPSYQTRNSGAGRANLRKVVVRKYDENIVKLLKELTKSLGSEGITAISRLIRAELCTCCRCMICKCKVKGRNFSMSSQEERYFHSIRSKLLESNVSMRHKFQKKSSQSRRNDSQDRDNQKELLAMDMAYSWAFDYFDNPDLENFEKERQMRSEKERLLAEEEEVTFLIEEVLKEEGVQPDESLSEIQTQQIVEKMREIMHFGMAEESKVDSSVDITNTGEKSEEKYDGQKGADDKKLEQSGKEKFLKQNKLEEEKNEKHKYPLSNQQPAKLLEHGKEGDILEVSTIRPIPSHGIATSSRKPKRKKKLQKNLNEPKNQKAKRTSYKESFTLSQESTQLNGLPSNAPGGKSHLRENASIPQDFREHKKLLKEGSDFMDPENNGNADLGDDNKIQTIKEVEEPEEKSKAPKVIKLSSKLVLALTRASEAAKMRVEARNTKMHPSMRLYTDICNCLPGSCTCGSHYLFRNIKQATPVDYVRDDANSEEIMSEQSSCLCFHSMDDIEEEKMPDSKFGLLPRPKTRQEEKYFCVKKPKYEKTVIIVKPDAMKYKDVILRAIKMEGLDIIDQRLLQLTPEQVTEIYDENYGSAYFFMFVTQMSSTPVLVLSVAGISAIDRWKQIIGEEEVILSSWFYPDSIKRRFTLCTDIYGTMKTSSDSDSAKRDLKYFFPLDILEPISIDSKEVQDYCDKYIHPTLLTVLYKIVREKPEDPLMYLADWVLRNNPNTPSFPDILTALAPT